VSSPFDYIRQRRERAEADRKTQEDAVKEAERQRAAREKAVQGPLIAKYGSMIVKVLSDLSGMAYPGSWVAAPVLGESHSHSERPQQALTNSEWDLGPNWSICYKYMGGREWDEERIGTHVNVTIVVDSKGQPVRFVCWLPRKNEILADFSYEALVEALRKLHP
jgi:hypothetical protein